MGYCVESMESNFLLKKENVLSAWDAIKKLFEKNLSIGWAQKTIIDSCHSFEEVMEECGWNVESNQNGDYDYIYFTDEKYGENERVLEAIAPYIEKDSYIQMHGEDGEIWRWIFIDGQCIEKYATLVF